MIDTGYKLIRIECDECKKRSDAFDIKKNGDFSQAIAEARELGWHIHRDPDGWTHFCSLKCKINYLK